MAADPNDVPGGTHQHHYLRGIWAQVLTLCGLTTTSSDAIGAKADSAATTDSGTFSLIALFKRLLSKSGGVVTAGSQAGSGPSPVAVTAGKRCVTLIVTAGTVQLASGPFLPAGTYTWAVDGPGDTLAAMTFTGDASAAYVLLTTTPS